MAKRPLLSLLGQARWTCKSCQTRQWTQRAAFTSSRFQSDELGIRAAPEIDFEKTQVGTPARIIPASPSYFTGSPVFNDDLLELQSLLKRYSKEPTIPGEKAPRIAWLRISQYRGTSGEQIAVSKYAQILRILTRLNRIHPQARPQAVKDIILRYQRPGSGIDRKAAIGKLDEYKRAKGVGRRKESSAKVYLVRGAGEIMINGKSLVDAFPRIHDRESAIWPLKIAQRLMNYNVFALVSGGGVTGQAEAITLGLARALLIHEPQFKPLLRRAGCITRDRRIVERKKPGRLKARKKPAWVKR